MTVVVNLPNGEKVEAQITPHTTVRQILGTACEACSKDTNTHCLRYKGKQLDETCRLHYATIDEKDIELDLAPLEVESGPVRICLDVKGLMFFGFFDNNVMLLEIVRVLCPEEFLIGEELVPIVSYLKQDFIGFGRLQATTLSKLGLELTRVTLRLSFQGAPKNVPSKMKGSSVKQVRSSNAGGSSNPSRAKGGEMTIPDRNALIFTVPDVSMSDIDVDDDFFELSANEVKKMYQELIHKRRELEDRPLVTSVQREEEKAEKRKKILQTYNVSIIRIYFPDNYILQGRFHPLEKLSSVMEFIKDHLKDSSLGFYLYTTPPRCVLDKEKSLIELQCVPRAKIYFSASQGGNSGHFIKEELLSKAAEYAEAARAAANVRAHTRQEVKERPKSPEKLQTVKPTEIAPREKKKKEDVVPKWFKTK